ncbi:hypothetical protein B0H15DRAFT_870605 [Mycena belliarum]|uniref:Uncharacterized protein n=1 Tax=Mycena belliarum TaxID=1033014 RepID=A0AAD6XLA8_9AGAR|nr:hypothetical protein B0H15DRAFT_870605 [Mycena belliae]
MTSHLSMLISAISAIFSAGAGWWWWGVEEKGSGTRRVASGTHKFKGRQMPQRTKDDKHLLSAAVRRSRQADCCLRFQNIAIARYARPTAYSLRPGPQFRCVRFGGSRALVRGRSA